MVNSRLDLAALAVLAAGAGLGVSSTAREGAGPEACLCRCCLCWRRVGSLPSLTGYGEQDAPCDGDTLGHRAASGTYTRMGWGGAVTTLLFKVEGMGAGG